MKRLKPYACGAPFGASSTRANKVLKAHLMMLGGNLAYLVFCSLLQKTNVLNYAIEITAFQADKTVWFLHISLPSLVRSK